MDDPMQVQRGTQRRRWSRSGGRFPVSRALGIATSAILLAWVLVIVPAQPVHAIASTGTFFPLPPSRVLDTRTGNGAPVGQLGPGGVMSFVVTGVGGVPADGVAAVVLNMTVVSATAASYMTVWPTGETRTGNGAPPVRVGPGATLNVQVTARGGVPANGPTAVALNITAVGPSAESYLTAWPMGEARPTASNLNYRAGQVVPNLVVVKLGAGGAVSLSNDTGQTHVLADVVGWFGVALPPVVATRRVTARDFFFDPASVVAPAGSTVIMTFANGGNFSHTMTSPEAGIEQQLDAAGSEASFTFTMPSIPTGFYCRFHQGAGMVGTLTPGAST